MSDTPVKVFNAFDMHFASNDINYQEIQETLDYCEVRFRSILLAFGGANLTRQRNIQRVLHKELVRFMIVT